MFDDFDDERQIGATHLGLPRIVLEGVDDLRLFERYWFASYMDRVDFVQANDLVQGSGCTAVAAAVKKSREVDKIPAFGFVDRDWLFRHRDWDNLFALDDADFEAATWNEEFYTTRRWEIEAYLLEPDLMADLVKSFTRSGKGTEAECRAALERALVEIENLLLVQRLFVACHVAGINRASNHLVHKLAEELETECEKELEAFTHENGLAAAAAVRPLLDAIVDSSPGPDEDKWRWLLRFVDTKRLIGRLSRRFDTVGDIRWFLATMMEKSGRRPQELEKRINEILVAA
ncbi:hypothetical protein NKH52_02735 [Mesorhizobium sp. M1066]|uniref:DUF4435 domain-containing protein n=1 Tax=Mesorhizobium opportunistum TaxID=593909 RepID=A0ABV1YJ76_9HYPH